MGHGGGVRIMLLGRYTDEVFGFPRSLQLQSLNALFILAFEIGNLDTIGATNFI